MTLSFRLKPDYSVAVIVLQVLSFMTGTYIWYSIGVKNDHTMHNQDFIRQKISLFFERTLQLMGGKLKPMIIYHLAIEGLMRFGELKRSIEGITERMLTRQISHRSIAIQ